MDALSHMGILDPRRHGTQLAEYASMPRPAKAVSRAGTSQGPKDQRLFQKVVRVG